MLITETITITRANTSVEWPSLIAPDDPNSPWPTANVVITSATSNDDLSKTITRLWTSKEEFVTVHAYIGPNTSFLFDSITYPGITHTRSIITTD